MTKFNDTMIAMHEAEIKHHKATISIIKKSNCDTWEQKEQLNKASNFSENRIEFLKRAIKSLKSN